MLNVTVTISSNIMQTGKHTVKKDQGLVKTVNSAQQGNTQLMENLAECVLAGIRQQSVGQSASRVLLCSSEKFAMALI